MRFSNVAVADLKTIEDCDTAVSRIENDYNNYQGGLRAWNSGYEVHPLAGAKKKLEAIQRKNDAIWARMIKADYKQHLKTEEFCTFKHYEEHFVC